MIKNILATIAFVGATIAPALADSNLHLDLTTSYSLQNSLVKNSQQVGTGTATVSYTLFPKLALFSDVSANILTRGTSSVAPATTYSAATYDFGAQVRFSRSTFGVVTVGTGLEDNLVLPGQARTVRQLNASITTRVF